MLNYQKMILAMVTIFEERRCQVEQRRVAFLNYQVDIELLSI